MVPYYQGMASLDDVIAKIPRSIFVSGVLIFTLAFIVYTNPLQDGCDVQMGNFNRTVRGVLIGYKNKADRTQLPQIENFKANCREGNSQGSCEKYYLALRKITDGLKSVANKCAPMLIESYENLPKVLSNGIQIMALNAWGERPPSGVNERLGWLTEPDIYTFCRLRAQLVKLTSEENYKSLRAMTYEEFPDVWPESVTIVQRAEIPRPRALKSATNPKGTLTSDEIFRRSLFSLRCDLYL